MSLEQVKELARQISEAGNRQRGLYLDLARVVRWMQLEPKPLRKLLAEAGWPPPRVSEFLRVVNVSAPMWASFEKDFVGWRVALAKSRGREYNPALRVNRLVSDFVRVYQSGLLSEPRLHVESGGFFVCGSVSSIPEKGLSVGGVCITKTKTKDKDK